MNKVAADNPTLNREKKQNILIMISAIGLVLLCFQNIALASNDALDIFREKRKLDSAQTFLDEGRREFVRGGYVRSIRVLTQAVNKGADPEAFKLRGQAYNFLGSSDKAINDFSSYISANGSDPEGFILLGDAYSTNLKHEKALPNFTKAIELDPSSVDAYLGRGIAHLGLEQYGSAIKDFRLALQHDPNNTDATINLGLAYWLADRPAEAKSYFEKALDAELDPKWKLRLAAYIRDLPATASDRFGDPPDEHDASSAGPETTISSGPVETPAGVLRHPKRASIGPGLDPTAWSGRWEGSYMGSRLRMEFQQAGGKFSGILRIQALTGREDVYHFRGIFDGKKIIASHSDGHSFSGKLTENRRMVGVLTTASGMKLNLDIPVNQ